MAETTESKKEEADYKRLHSFPLIRHTDMPEEMRVETMELCVTACEKFATNNENAAKMIKESMDKKFGSSWHVVIGEGFGFEHGEAGRASSLSFRLFGIDMSVPGSPPHPGPLLSLRPPNILRYPPLLLLFLLFVFSWNYSPWKTGEISLPFLTKQLTQITSKSHEWRLYQNGCPHRPQGGGLIQHCQ
uniref:Dynein axonemal light chain 4 n=1 Tax=Salmo trutta TaxID=8032 RepID=A0A673WIC6_SALTR